MRTQICLSGSILLFAAGAAQAQVRLPLVRLQAPAPPTTFPPNRFRINGTLVRTLPDNSMQIRTLDGRDIIVYYSPTNTYRFGNRDVLVASVPIGSSVDLMYYLEENRNVLVNPPPPPAAAPTTILQGRLVLTSSTPPTALLIADSGEQIRLTFDDQARSVVEIENRNGVNVVRSVNPLTAGALAPPNASAPAPGLTPSTPVPAANVASVEGRILRMAANYFVLRTPQGDDLAVYGDLQTKYTLDGRPAGWGDLDVEQQVVAQYVVDGARRIARTITALTQPPPP